MSTCINCSTEVTDDHDAIVCDRCNRCAHISCDTGVTYDRYIAMIAGDIVINWQCNDCSTLASALLPSTYGIIDPDAGDIAEDDVIMSDAVLIPARVPQLPEAYEIIEGGNNNKGVSFNIIYDNTKGL